MVFKPRPKLALLLFVTHLSCSNGSGEIGKCKPLTSSTNNAVTEDPDGKEWKLVISPAETTIECDRGKGNITLNISIRNGQGIVTPGLGLNFGPISGAFKIVEKDTTNITDSCGLATLVVEYTCPNDEGQKQSSIIVVNSGALSNTSKVSVEKKAPPAPTITTTPTTTTTPAPSTNQPSNPLTFSPTPILSEGNTH